MTIDSPINQEIINGKTVCLQGRVTDDKGIRSARLFVNGTTMSLFEEIHLLLEHMLYPLHIQQLPVMM